MRDAAESGCLWAADAAEYLVLRLGVPFRTAYAAGRKLVEAWSAAAASGRWGRTPALQGLLANMGSQGLSALHPAWAGAGLGELAAYLSLDACIARRDLPGGPASARVEAELARLGIFIDEATKRLG
jgi:argininosuccinate lyase